MSKEILVLYAILGFLVFFRYSTEDSKYPIIGIKPPKTRFKYVIYTIFAPTMIAYWIVVNTLLFIMMLIMFPCVIFAEFIMIPIYIVDFLCDVKSNGLSDNEFIRKVQSNKFYKFMFKEF